MKSYQGIVFDLFATLALWHPERLPRFTWHGKTFPSTMGVLQHAVNELVTEANFEDFYEAFTQTNESHAAFRKQENKEIPSHNRFLETLKRIGYLEDVRTTEIAETLSLKHMELLMSVVEVPRKYVPFLKALRNKYSLGLCSNFDHTPTALAILERDGIAELFNVKVVSEDHGLRKPHPDIFLDTVAGLGLQTEQVLFVGDSIEDDVIGADAAGIDMAWVNAKDTRLPPSVRPPSLEIRAVTDLSDFLL